MKKATQLEENETHLVPSFNPSSSIRRCSLLVSFGLVSHLRYLECYLLYLPYSVSVQNQTRTRVCLVKADLVRHVQGT
jgi:hypothetical protein